MILTEGIKAKIEELFNITPDDIHCVSLGYKYKDGVNTGKIGIVFNVLKKQNINELKPSDVLPPTITVDGVDIITDVIETKQAVNLSCYLNEYNPPQYGFITKDYNVTRLTGFYYPLLSPMKGGQQITPFPTGWAVGTDNSLQFTVGTLGIFCLDSIDSRVVCLTNSHVLVTRRDIATDRDTVLEGTDPYNIYQNMTFAGDGNKYPPGVVAHNIYPNYVNVGRLKRYIPTTETGLNYVDAAIYMPVDSYVDVDSSYHTWRRADDDNYAGKPIRPFATTSEIDEIFGSGGRISSTGRTTGPKGYVSTLTKCQLMITGLGVTVNVNESATKYKSWGDCISFQNKDASLWPIAGGDSGSVLIAEVNGVEKIVGLAFAGNTGTGYANRIDRVAQELKIEAFNSTHNTTVAVPTTYTIKLSDQRASQATITINGKIYYQAGFAVTPTPTPTPTPT